MNARDGSTAAARPGVGARPRGPLEDPRPLLAPLGPGAGDGLEQRLDAWLAAPLDALIAEHGPALRAVHAARFGRRVVVFAPLYVTSACLNDCVYCGFRRSNPGTRVKLGPDAVLREARALADAGHRTIDLVSGEIPTARFVADTCDIVARILAETPIETLNLNLGALSAEQYAALFAAGAAAYHLYQETYDEAVYLRVHRRGPKRDMANRLHAARRVLAAGFERIGMGVLLGLAPLASDLAALVRHARLLSAEFPRARIGLSLPRIVAAEQEPGFVAAARIDDDAFAKALLFLRRELPDAHLTLTTRERAELRDRLLPLGVTKLSAGVCTAPGGYAHRGAPSRAQFSIHDERSLEEIAACIRAAGLLPVTDLLPVTGPVPSAG